MKPFIVKGVDHRALDVIPVVDDPGGPRLLVTTGYANSALLDTSGAAKLRNELSNWLNETRRGAK